MPGADDLANLLGGGNAKKPTSPGAKEDQDAWKKMKSVNIFANDFPEYVRIGGPRNDEEEDALEVDGPIKGKLENGTYVIKPKGVLAKDLSPESDQHPFMITWNDGKAQVITKDPKNRELGEVELIRFLIRNGATSIKPSFADYDSSKDKQFRMDEMDRLFLNAARAGIAVDIDFNVIHSDPTSALAKFLKDLANTKVTIKEKDGTVRQITELQRLEMRVEASKQKAKQVETLTNTNNAFESQHYSGELEKQTKLGNDPQSINDFKKSIFGEGDQELRGERRLEAIEKTVTEQDEKRLKTVADALKSMNTSLESATDLLDDPKSVLKNTAPAGVHGTMDRIEDALGLGFVRDEERPLAFNRTGISQVRLETEEDVIQQVKNFRRASEQDRTNLVNHTEREIADLNKRADIWKQELTALRADATIPPHKQEQINQLEEKVNQVETFRTQLEEYKQNNTELETSLSSRMGLGNR